MSRSSFLSQSILVRLLLRKILVSHYHSWLPALGCGSGGRFTKHRQEADKTLRYFVALTSFSVKGLNVMIAFHGSSFPRVVMIMNLFSQFQSYLCLKLLCGLMPFTHLVSPKFSVNQPSSTYFICLLFVSFCDLCELFLFT